MTTHLTRQVEVAEAAFGAWATEHGKSMLRVSLGLIFLWFGVLKFCPGLCDVEILAAKTTQLLTLGLIPAAICVKLLGLLECSIGLALMSGRQMKLTTIVLLGHLLGTFLPLVLFPADTWKHFPYAPTLVGQYILKNLILVSAGLVVGAGAFGKATVPVLKLVPRPRSAHAGKSGAGRVCSDRFLTERRRTLADL